MFDFKTLIMSTPELTPHFELPTDEWATTPATRRFHDYRRIVYKEAKVAAFCQRKGFPRLYTKWQIARLPIFIVNEGVTVIDCPWCMQGVTMQSLHKDHIVPIQKLVRFFALRRARTMAMFQGENAGRSKPRLIAYVPDANTFETNKEFLENLFSNANNVIFCCADCNIKFSDNLKPDKILSTALRLYASNRLITEKLKNAIKTNEMLRAEIKRHENGPFANYIEGGIAACGIKNWNPRNMATGGALDKEEYRVNQIFDNDDYERSSRGYNSDAVIIRLLSDFNNAWVKDFVKGRPKWRLNELVLLASQLPYIQRKFVGRVCFYCLGVYNDAAFQIDHIKAWSTTSKRELASLGLENHIPVCSFCNRDKSASRLSATWMAAQVQRRRDALVPGVENATEFGYRKTYSIEEALAIRARVFKEYHVHDTAEPGIEIENDQNHAMETEPSASRPD